MTGRDEGGQSAVLMAGVVFVAGTIGVAIVGLGLEGVGRARAQAVADLTALAATHDERDGRTVATKNGGRLLELRHDGAEVTVTVELDGRRATAAAVRD